MLLNYWIWLAIVTNVITNIGFKMASLVTNNPTKKWITFAIALIFGFINSACMTESLKTIPLNIASAIFFSLSIVGLSFSSYLLFHEILTWKQIVGTITIIASVILVCL